MRRVGCAGPCSIRSRRSTAQNRGFSRSTWCGGMLTRKEFLLCLGFAAWATTAPSAPPEKPGAKVLLVVAHPDDEYTFAATVDRIAKELNGTVDQVVITN